MCRNRSGILDSHFREIPVRCSTPGVFLGSVLAWTICVQPCTFRQEHLCGRRTDVFRQVSSLLSPCASTASFLKSLHPCRSPNSIDTITTWISNMSGSMFNPLSALASLFPSSRLSNNLASIHCHVSHELEPDYFTEWEKGQPRRHRSDTSTSSSSSLFPTLDRDRTTSRWYSALEQDNKQSATHMETARTISTSEADKCVQRDTRSTSPPHGTFWKSQALDTVQIYGQSISVPIDAAHVAFTRFEATAK